MTTINYQPRPTGHRILVEKIAPKTQTAGGIHLPDTSMDAESYLTITAKVIEIGPTAYRDRETGEAWRTGPWCKVGDWVIIPKFVQLRMSVEDREFRLVNDDEIYAVVEDPTKIKVYA